MVSTENVFLVPLVECSNGLRTATKAFPQWEEFSAITRNNHGNFSRSKWLEKYPIRDGVVYQLLKRIEQQRMKSEVFGFCLWQQLFLVSQKQETLHAVSRVRRVLPKECVAREEFTSVFRLFCAFQDPSTQS